MNYLGLDSSTQSITALVIDTDDNERAILSDIEVLDKKVQAMRQMLRNGERLEDFKF